MINVANMMDIWNIIDISLSVVVLGIIIAICIKRYKVSRVTFDFEDKPKGTKDTLPQLNKLNKPKRPIKIIHIGRDSFWDYKGVITIITEVCGDNLRLGFAFCAPGDRFNKKTGRRIAFKEMFRFNGKCLTTKFTGHSSEDIVRFFNDEMDASEKPYRWRNVKLNMRANFTLDYYIEPEITEEIIWKPYNNWLF